MRKLGKFASVLVLLLLLVPALPFVRTTSATTSTPTCNPALVRANIKANVNEWPTLAINGSNAFYTPGANFSLKFYAWDYDAPLFATADGPCDLAIDATSFSQLNVTKVAYSVDGGKQTTIPNAALKHQRELIMCSDRRFFSSLMTDWVKCGEANIYAVQTWGFDLKFSLTPNSCENFHAITVYAWGQNGIGPSAYTTLVSNHLCDFGGPSYGLQFPTSDVGRYEWVNVTGTLLHLTPIGPLEEHFSASHLILVPPSGTVYGMSMPYSTISASGSGIQKFTVADDYLSTQVFVVP